MEAAIRSRRHKVQSNYLDLGQLIDYWSPARFNHHTAPTSMVYGLREALRAVQVRGTRRRDSPAIVSTAMRCGPASRPWASTLFGKEPPEHRLPFITPVVVPDGVDELRVRGG